MRKNKKLSKTAKTLTGNTVLYFLLIVVGFVYLYPIIYMSIISLMPTKDLINPTIEWIPTKLDFSVYRQVYEIMDYSKTLIGTVLYALSATVLQTAICVIVGYAFARYPIYGKKFWVLMLVIVFIIPADVITIPRYILYNQYGLVGSQLSVMLPALFGQGIKSTVFILLFMQSFSSYPKAYDEAARIDGAGEFRIFIRVALPLAKAILLLSFLFSFIWYWNETSQIDLFLSGEFSTLPTKLAQFDSLFGSAVAVVAGSDSGRLNEHVQMAATIMAIAPLVVLYFIAQKGMISSVENSGITGE